MRSPILTIVVGLAAAAALVGLGAGGALLLDDDPDVLDRAEPSATDVGFAQDMSVHHGQAVLMCDIVAGNPDPTIVTLASRIRTAQLGEIGRMQGFLMVWGESALPTGEPMQWMHPAPSHHSAAPAAAPSDEGMPGLATQDQIDRLRTSTGSDQAVLFLQLMLHHHEGGVDMADYAAKTAVMPAVHDLATAMAFEQRQENQVIGQLLIAAGIDPRAPPP